MLSQDIEIENKQGFTLSGVIEWPPNGEVHAYAVFAHCFTCGKNSHASTRISRILASRGIAVVRFDFTGIGESEGQFANTNFTTNVEDLLSFIDYLSEHNMTPELLIGHSFGGAAVLAAASQRDAIKAVVTIGAPAQPEHVAHLLPDNLDDLAADETVEVQLGPCKYKFKKQFLLDIEKQNTDKMLFGLEQAVLICHSPDDEIVDISNAEKIFSALHHPKSFLSLDGMKHLIINKENARYIAGVIEEWASRYLSPIVIPQDEMKDPDVIAVLSEENYTTMIRSGKHAMIADEPLEVGGQNQGPSPYQYVSAGLAACTAMTLRMYTDRKGWAVGKIEVRVDHEKKHITDSEGTDTLKKNKVDHFLRTIHVEKDITEEQKKRILEIANKCPVHRTLTSEILIPTSYSLTSVKSKHDKK